MNKRYILSCLVDNHSGVLTKISGLFSRRGYNIESLSVCATEDEKLSRMTIVAFADEYILEQIIKQLDKLHDVKYVTCLSGTDSVERELLLIKISNRASEIAEIMEITKVYKAKTIDLSPTSTILELIGDSNKIDAFIKILQGYEILEMARTGITALFRDRKCLKEQVSYYKDK